MTQPWAGNPWTSLHTGSEGSDSVCAGAGTARLCPEAGTGSADLHFTCEQPGESEVAWASALRAPLAANSASLPLCLQEERLFPVESEPEESPHCCF